MNVHVDLALQPNRYRLTIDDWNTLEEAGHLDPLKKYELIDGGLFEVPEDGFRTIRWNVEIAEWLFSKLLGKGFQIIPDKTLKFDRENAPSPDFYVFPRGVEVKDFEPDDALLVIEVTDTTIPMDTKVKRDLYARFGVRDYWVVLCEAQEVWVYRLNPDEAGSYLEPVKHAFEDVAEALLIEGLKLCLAELPGLK